ncbi:MAG: hypothetical protein ACHQAU_01410 [Gammaproteobacteria bacterium]
MLSRTQEGATKHTEALDISQAGNEVTAAISASNASAVSWSAVFAGAVAAAGLSLILLFAGAGLGLSVTSPWAHQGADAGAIAVAAILWLSLTQIVASWLGGYLAGRLRTKWVRLHDHEVTFRDTAHGLISWALATVVVALIASSAIGSAISGGAQALGAVANTAATEISGPVTVAADSLFRGDANAPTAPQATDPALRAEASQLFTDALKGKGGLAGDDSRYLAQLVAQRTGLNAADAQQRVDATYTEVRARVQKTEATAKQAADKARKDSAYTALWFAIALLIGAFTASLSATYGGRTRDLA